MAELGITDLSHILNQLKLFPNNKWEDFGLKAGLYAPTLSAIEGDCDKCFKRCLSLWLERADNVNGKGKPTWQRLAEILEEMGNKALADTITEKGLTNLSLEPPATTTEPPATTAEPPHKYSVPLDVENEYLKMNDEFSFILDELIDEIIEKGLLDKLKSFLVGARILPKEEIKQVCEKLDIIDLLRKCFFVSNFETLLRFSQRHEMKSKEKIEAFAKERDGLYCKILAEEFAKKAIEDHKRKEYHGEMIFKVSWSLNTTTLNEFQKFLTKVFYKHIESISLRVVQQSVLTFICTIPKWLVGEMKEYVHENEELLKSSKVVELIIDGTVMFSTKGIDVTTPPDPTPGVASAAVSLTSSQSKLEDTATLSLPSGQSSEVTEDLYAILHWLKRFPKDKWEEFGLKAGLYAPTLSTIRDTHRGNSEKCFRECLSLWLKRADNVDGKGKPTWQRLADILEEMGNKALADTIRIGKGLTNLSLEPPATTAEPPATTTELVSQPRPTPEPHPGYPVPFDLKDKYSKMNDDFALILDKFTDEIVEENLLEKLKSFLLARFKSSHSDTNEKDDKEREAEITQVRNEFSLTKLLLKYFFVSNFGTLITFAQHRKMKSSKKFEAFAKERDDLYSKVLAKDFAKKAIEDHKKMECHGEMIFKVVWSLTTTLMEFQLFLADVFHSHEILISLRVVQQSVLTFYCTIPKWLVGEMKEYVHENEELLKSKKVVELIIDGTVMFSLKGTDVATSPDPTPLKGAATAVSLTSSQSKPEVVAGILSDTKHDTRYKHDLEYIKLRITMSFSLHTVSYFFYDIQPRLDHHLFLEFFYKSLDKEHRYHDREFRSHYDMIHMFRDEIVSCQSHPEVARCCNAFLNAVSCVCSRDPLHGHGRAQIVLDAAKELKDKWEDILGIKL